MPNPTATSHAPLHPVSWLIWLLAALVAASSTRNPLYLLLLLLTLSIVVAVQQTATERAGGPLPLSPIRFAAIVITMAAIFNAATTHYGKTVFFVLPEALPLVGGKITLEALVYGLVNGLVISCLFAAFTVLHLALPIRAIIRFLPRAFYPLALVISIAVTFVPTTLRQFQHIREAQAIRGHRLRGIRDWMPLFLPLLIGGLERALQLAEAMTARGFASSESATHAFSLRLAVVVGLGALLTGWLLRLVWGQDIVGLALMVPGSGVILGSVWAAGRQKPHTVYRRERWSYRDAWVLAGAAVVLLVFLTLLPGIDRKTLAYSPYPLATLPVFHTLVGATILGLLPPAILIWYDDDGQEHANN